MSRTQQKGQPNSPGLTRRPEPGPLFGGAIEVISAVGLGGIGEDRKAQGVRAGFNVGIGVFQVQRLQALRLRVLLGDGWGGSGAPRRIPHSFVDRRRRLGRVIAQKVDDALGRYRWGRPNEGAPF